MTTREPLCETHDAVIDLEPARRLATRAYVLVKRTYRLGPEGCEALPAEPLDHDLRDETLQPRMPLGSDFWTVKQATDVVLIGSAFAPGGRPVEQMEVRCEVGDQSKRVAVFGPRELEWPANGSPRFGPPEPFVEVPVTCELAYGGIDPRVLPRAAPTNMHEALGLATDHPGIYPRNPFGLGYLVVPERATGMMLPLLEDPDDLLTAERVVVGEPERWFRQPLPWTLDWLHPLMLPRLLLAGGDAHFPAPDEDLAEVQRGYVPAASRESFPGDEPLELHELPAPLPGFYQEASLGMTFPWLGSGCPIKVEGMHPDGRSLTFSLPPEPAVSLEVEGHSEAARANLTTVVIRPGDETVNLVYHASRDLPRPFIPGVHRHIPVSATIEGARLRYQAPEPVRDRVSRTSP